MLAIPPPEGGNVDHPPMESPTKADLEQAMKGHVLEKAELIGTYQKS